MTFAQRAHCLCHDAAAGARFLRICVVIYLANLQVIHIEVE